MTAALFTTNGAALLEDLLQRGVSAGASLVEVFAERTDHLGLLAEQDNITSVNPSFACGAGIRVFRGERDGFVSTNDLSVVCVSDMSDLCYANPDCAQFADALSECS